MPNNTESGRERVIREERTRPAWISFAVALLPVLAGFLGGTTEKWAEGLVVAALGFLLVVDPPRHSLGVALNAVLIALVACAALAFLPANWFFQPPWRAVMTSDFGIKLAATLSPQPWITLGCFISFVAGLSWFYYVCAQEFTMRDVRRQVRIFAAGIVLLAAISILLYTKGTAISFWHNQRGFGPFPNRNQTGDLFGITAIMLLASGQDHFRRGKSHWILSALGFFILVAALILNFSRSGILILVCGSAIWLIVMAFRQASFARVAVGLSLVLVLLTTLLIFGGPTLERFHLRGGATEGGISSDFRWLIFRDAWRVIWNSPWCGIGLGNFEPIFAISRIASVADTRSLHPESDWLWLWTELGWPGVLLIVIGIALIVPHVFPLREGTNQRIRLAALIAAAVFALHGFIDVSAHRIGTAFAGIFLFGSALHRPFQCRYSRALPIIFRIVGIVLLIIGMMWSVVRRYQLPLPGLLGADNLRRAATIMYRSKAFDETIAMTTRALSWAPLDWRLYSLRARAQVDARKNRASTIADFRRARFLEPNGYEVPFEEGTFWLIRREPILAITAWREALHRAGPRQREIYGDMFFNSPPNPAFLGELTEMARNNPELMIAGLDRVSRDRFSQVLSNFFESDPDLRSFTPEQKTKLLMLWAERGDLEKFAHAVETHPEWQAAAWEGMARYYASKESFRTAVETTLQFATPPVLPTPNESVPLESLQRQFQADPNNFAVGYALYREQMRQGKLDDALATVRHFTALPTAPAYFHFLEVQSWAAKENWERAWNAWLAFERANKK